MAEGHLNPELDQSPSELKRQIEAESVGPFLVHRGVDGNQHLCPLQAGSRLTIGRDDGNEIVVDDQQVSRVHAEIETIGGAWVVSDQGLSTNGTFVNGERIDGRVRLEDRDLIVVGRTGILFRLPSPGRPHRGTVAADSTSEAGSLTETQRMILIALCRPYGSGESFATPATNRTIAAEVHLSIDGVKGHLRVLYDRFGLSDLSQNEKRARLAERALRSGAVKPSDLR